MLSAGFEHTVPASQRLHTHALDRAATGIGTFIFYLGEMFNRNQLIDKRKPKTRYL
jgi:hypothetical protein